MITLHQLYTVGDVAFVLILALLVTDLIAAYFLGMMNPVYKAFSKAKKWAYALIVAVVFVLGMSALIYGVAKRTHERMTMVSHDDGG